MIFLRHAMSLICTFALIFLGASACTTSHVPDSAIEDLERQYSALQEAYEGGAISDVQLRSGFRMFFQTDQDMSPTLNAWVRAMPKSYVAHLSRGIYLDSRGVKARGDDNVDETTAKQFKKMRSFQKKAMKELNRSFDLTRKPLLSYYYALDISNYNGDEERNRTILDEALKVDPGSIIIRERYMWTLETRWGGGQAEMLAFLTECERANLSPDAISRLKAAVVEDQAWVARFREKKPRKAADLYMEAFNLGADAYCATCAGFAYFDSQDFALSVDAFTAAIKRNPLDPNAYYGRGMSYMYSQHFEESRADLEHSAQLGFAAAQFALGQSLDGYVFGPPQRELGRIWIKKAADQEYSRAVEYLADLQGK